LWYNFRMSWKLPVVVVSLLVVAVLAAGAGSAQAANTTICTTSNVSQMCSFGFQQPSGTVYKAVASGTNAVQTSSGDSLSCTASTIEFKTTARAATPLPAEVLSWTLSGCTDIRITTPCSVSSFGVLPYNMSIQWTGSDHGTLKVTDSPNPSLIYVCGSVICSFETPEIKLETSSLTPAIANMSAFMTQNGGGASCGGVSKLLGKFTFVSPSPGTFFVEHD
jgi:hypothetical protein